MKEIAPDTYDILAGIAERVAKYWTKLRLSELDAPACERLKAAMRADGRSESTVSKSFVQVIRPALAEERRLGNFALDPT